MESNVMNAEQWRNLKTRMTGYWDREAMDRCCVAFSIRQPGFRDPCDRNLYFDAVTSDQVHRIRMAHHRYYGEGFPCLFPYFGTAGVCEYTGCKPEYTPETTWFAPWLEEPDADAITYRCPDAFLRQKETVRQMVDLAKGDYPVSVTDNAGILDALASIRGSDALLVDMLTEPEFVTAAAEKLVAIYKQTQQELFDVVQENNQGAVHSWMQLWAPRRFAQLQCDMSVMISPELYGRFVLPVLEELTEFLDYSIYHFDGQEQIRHLDHLLSVKNLNGIQWTRVAGQPRTSDFIPVFQKIQKAGKNLVLFPDRDEVIPLLDHLSCRGLQLLIGGIRNEEEAAEMMKLAEKHSKDRKL